MVIHAVADRPALNLSAYGEVKTAPDMATISFGVVTEATTAAEAMRLNATRMNEVMAALRPPPKSGDAGNWLGVTLRRENEGAERKDGILGSGDSGGSAWVRTGAGWAIAGVNANGNGDTYGSQCWFARVSGVRDWLSATVPGLRFVT